MCLLTQFLVSVDYKMSVNSLCMPLVENLSIYLKLKLFDKANHFVVDF